MATPSHTELMKMKDMTRMTGYLTNAQTKQLQMWPIVILGAQDAQIEFDPETHEVMVDVMGIDYASIFAEIERLAYTSEQIAKEYRKRLQAFDQCVKYLLGNEYAVTVKFKGVVLGRSPPAAPSEGAHPPDFERAEEWLKKQKK